MSTILKALRRVEGEKKEREANERFHGEVTGEGAGSPGRRSREVRLGAMAAALLAVVAGGAWFWGMDSESTDPPPAEAAQALAEESPPRPARPPVAPPSRQPTVAKVKPPVEATTESDRLSIAEYQQLHESPTAGSPPAPRYVPPPPPAPPPAPEPEPLPPPPKPRAAAPSCRSTAPGTQPRGDRPRATTAAQDSSLLPGAWRARRARAAPWPGPRAPGSARRAMPASSPLAVPVARGAPRRARPAATASSPSETPPRAITA